MLWIVLCLLHGLLFQLTTELNELDFCEHDGEVSQLTCHIMSSRKIQDSI